MSKLTIPCKVDHVSDGYNSFIDLYEHRNMLWLYIINTNLDMAFKTKLDYKGDSFPGYFIAGINNDVGQLTYYMPNDLWDKCMADPVDSNFDYDGHSSNDVLQRLEKLASNI